MKMNVFLLRSADETSKLLYKEKSRPRCDAKGKKYWLWV